MGDHACRCLKRTHLERDKAHIPGGAQWSSSMFWISPPCWGERFLGVFFKPFLASPGARRGPNMKPKNIAPWAQSIAEIGPMATRLVAILRFKFRTPKIEKTTLRPLRAGKYTAEQTEQTEQAR